MADIIHDVKARLVERIQSPADLLVFKLGSALKMEHRPLWTLDALASGAGRSRSGLRVFRSRPQLSRAFRLN